jgi:hypothetical protein
MITLTPKERKRYTWLCEKKGVDPYYAAEIIKDERKLHAKKSSPLPKGRVG